MDDRRRGVLRYAIDGEDRLVNANLEYFAFAAENDFPDAEATIGTPLWDFVAGSSVREVQRTLLRRIRRTGRTVVLPFRCDSPGARREHLLKIEPGADPDRIVFTAWILEEQHRPRQAVPDREQPRKRRAITMCSWCGRVEDGSDWVEMEQAADDLGLTDGAFGPGIRHDLCDRCVLVLSET